MTTDKTALLQCRCAPMTRERAELAAAECEMDLGTWIRAIIEGALDLHFEEEQPEPDDVPDPVEEPAAYLERIDEEARAWREAERPVAPPTVIHPGLHEGRDQPPGAPPAGGPRPGSEFWRAQRERAAQGRRPSPIRSDRSMRR